MINLSSEASHSTAKTSPSCITKLSQL